MGNLWEWCEDLFGDRGRIYRGGAFVSDISFARSAHREAGDPEQKAYKTGVRPARTLEP